jgi:hypothetical protein
MARVLMKCPETGQTVFTCQRMKPPEFDSLERELGFRCPSCDKIHKWSKADAWLEEAPASAAVEAREVLSG